MTAYTGPWPVVLTPYDASGAPDLAALDRYVDWLIDHRSAGLFPVALSGEMYELTPNERTTIARRVVELADGRVPVAAAALGRGDALVADVDALAETGVDVVVLVVSDLLDPDDDESALFDAVDTLIAQRDDVSFGIYECPIPHHRLLSLAAVERLARTGRFTFFKETSHDVERMRARVEVGAPHGLAVFNAGIENYVESLAVGVAGLSGWVVNVAPDLVARIGDLVAAGDVEAALALQATLAAVEQTMGATYPSSAKDIASRRGELGLLTASRWRPSDIDDELTTTLTNALTTALEEHR